ncbi:hypothetical protein G6O67_002980 [Ophiocordyceps sinensis]|uniref:Uncharacterized protein n=1 Tax=Ophiocordyceps sinensis TaxID=72228 RepID=A0A8H4V7U5_9HYPO|nr:hypothetical protein G6O67_002980 [Ophiocordyceps sinensis]
MERVTKYHRSKSHRSKFRRLSPGSPTLSSPSTSTLALQANIAFDQQPDSIQQGKVIREKLQQRFVKLWSKDKNYTGEPYNLLDDKL